MLELMLLREVKGLGDPGDVVKVKKGYARNFLLPRRLAAPVSKDALRQAEAHKRRLVAERARIREEAERQAKALQDMSIHVEARASEGGTLYGSVTSTTIADAIAKEGVNVAASAVRLEEPIKELGIYEVVVSPAEGVESTVRLYVVQPPPGQPGDA